MAIKMFLVVIYCLVFSCEGYPKFDVKLSNVYFDGGYLMFPVKEEKIRQRLDEVNSHFDEEGVQLILPTDPMLQEHVIMVAFGTMEAVAFNTALENGEITTESNLDEALGIIFPYLSSSGDVDRITLQTKLYSASEGDIIEANVILPPPTMATHYSRVTQGTTTNVTFESDDLQFSVTIGHEESCQLYGKHGIKDTQEYEREYQISQYGPDFSICDKYPDLKVDLCDVYRKPIYNSAIKKAGNNVCIYWVSTDDVENCETNSEEVSMSNSMRELLLLEEDAELIEAELQRGTFDIRLVVPCIE